MLSTTEFIRQSLELHLFFARIMCKGTFIFFTNRFYTKELKTYGASRHI